MAIADNMSLEWSTAKSVSRNINAQRHPIPDVPVLYLLKPTSANLSLINSDLAKGLYADAYINFLSSIPRPLMEDFASQIADSGTAESISQMYDQYLNFIVSEPDLFSLGMGKDTYWALNSPKATDEEIDVLVDTIVSGLFSVVVTMGTSLCLASGNGLIKSQVLYQLFAVLEGVRQR